MKKVVLVLFACLLAIGFASAAEIDLIGGHAGSYTSGGFFESLFGGTATSSSSIYYPGETLQAEIDNIFISPLTVNNFGVYAQNSVHKSPVDQGLLKSGDRYLYYAILPLSAGNYTLKIEDAEYMENNIQSDEPITKNISIAQTNESYLSFKPGYVSATSDFSVIIRAYNRAQTVNVEFEEAEFNQSFSLGNGNDKTVYISISNLESVTKSNITINNYILPVVVYPPASDKADVISEDEEEDSDTTSIPLDDLVDISKDEIEATVLEDYDYTFKIIVSRDTTRTLTGIKVSSSDDSIEVDPEEFDLEDDEETIQVTINTDKELDEEIEISYRNDSIKIPVKISLAENESDVVSNIPASNKQKTCSELGGLQCNWTAGEQCIGSKSEASDGICCVGTCKAKSSSSAWIWGILILALLVVVGWLIINKSKASPRRDEKTREILRQRSEEYEKRFDVDQPREVRRGLSRS